MLISRVHKELRYAEVLFFHSSMCKNFKIFDFTVEVYNSGSKGPSEDKTIQWTVMYILTRRGL